MRGYFEKYDLANMANMSNMANTRQSLNKNSNDMAKPFANGDFDKNGEFGENVEYSESSSRHPLKVAILANMAKMTNLMLQGPL